MTSQSLPLDMISGMSTRVARIAERQTKDLAKIARKKEAADRRAKQAREAHEAIEAVRAARASVRSSKRRALAYVGLNNLLQVGAHPGILKTIRLMGAGCPGLYLYEAWSSYDPQAPDSATIALRTSDLAIQWGVPDVADVHDRSIPYDATEPERHAFLDEIFFPDFRGFGKPITYLNTGWEVKDRWEGLSILLQILVDCSCASRLEQYLSYMTSRVEKTMEGTWKD